MDKKNTTKQKIEALIENRVNKRLQEILPVVISSVTTAVVKALNEQVINDSASTKPLHTQQQKAPKQKNTSVDYSKVIGKIAGDNPALARVLEETSVEQDFDQERTAENNVEIPGEVPMDFILKQREKNKKIMATAKDKGRLWAK